MLKIKNLFKSKTTKYSELILNSLLNKKNIEIDLFIEYKVKAFKKVFKKVQDDNRTNKILERITTIESQLDRCDYSFEAHLLFYKLRPILEINDDDRVKDRYLTLNFNKLNKKDYDYLVEKIEE